MREGSELTVVAEPPEAEWDGFVSTHPDATGYHLWKWRRICADAFGHQSHYLLARRDGQAAGVLPLVLFRTALFGRFAVSMPFVNYGGVLATDSAVARLLVMHASAEARRLRLAYVELRHRSRLFPDLPVRAHKVAMRMALPADPGTLWGQLDRKVRNQVRKAEKSGLTVETGGLERLDDFYRIFARNMRDLGTPVYSPRFFRRLLEEFPGAARVIIVRHTSRGVAAAISYAHRDTLEIPWAASLREYRSLCPGNLLYWTAMEEAVRNGFRTFDFGRSTPDAGTFQFKLQWGARPEPLFWEYHLPSRRALPDFSPTSPKFKLAVALWKRLPVRAASLFGPHIVRAIP